MTARRNRTTSTENRTTSAEVVFLWEKADTMERKWEIRIGKIVRKGRKVKNGGSYDEKK